MNGIFITGGARGIGLETARLFLAKGWRVGIFDRDEQAISAASLELNHPNLSTFIGDVLSTDDLSQALAAFTSSNEGKLELLHNNVGIVEVGEFDQMSVETHLKIVDINLKGFLITTSMALPYLKKAGKSLIINMSSASALYGNPEITTYAATKAAIKSLTEGWNIAFRKYGIRCADLIPIYVRTRMVDDYYQKYRKLDLKDVRLTAAMVSKVVWQATQGRRVHYYVGLDTKVYARLIKWLPESWLPVILRRVLGYQD